MRTIVSALLVSVAALALVGCGGDEGGEALSQEQYQEQLDQATTDLEEGSTDLNDELGAILSGDESVGDAAAEAVGTMVEQFRETASELEDVEPPENAQEANDEFVNGLRGYADELEEIQGSLEDGDLSEARSQLGRINELDSVQALQRAAEQLREAGYSVET